jgi:hypothetical protein
MRTATVTDLRNRFGQVIQSIEAGEDVKLTREALTGDRHFLQAGFVALLAEKAN